MNVRDTALAWLAQDPDAETRDELTALLARDDAGDVDARAELAARFAGFVRFGTAGLRGALGAGSARMNRVVVSYAAAGIAAFLRSHVAGRTPTAVIGYDGRRNSAVFARDLAEVLAGAGVLTTLLSQPVPTPVLAFAVRHRAFDAGVMVTASHNPASDNGCKVYLGGEDEGAQLVAPLDARIAAEIDRIVASTTADALPRSVGYRTAGEDLGAAYVAATARVATAPDGTALRWVYTAMHGVGWATFRRVVEATGFAEPITVGPQLEPDARFPTVPFPNPEEDGALELAFAAGRAVSADLILAHDPDADRLAVAVPDADAPDGWRRLGGNDVGLLLAWRAARHANASGAVQGASLASSLVSSPALAAIAAQYGLDVHTTLTGFKWIARAPGLVFGYEEALGYLVNPETVRDKDGISAAVAVLALATEARADGKTLVDLLDDLAALFGHHRSAQISVRVSDVAEIDALMTSLRAERPARIGDLRVRRMEDLRDGVDDLPPADVLLLQVKRSGRVVFRPSGTEPKLKAYLDVRGDTATEAEERLAALDAGVRALLAERT